MSTLDTKHSTQDLETILRERFGHPAFREGQREVCECLLGGEHALVVQPTGSGKSLCYQLPALSLEGVTLVVSPLISLMNDQVESLRSRGVAAAAVHSGMGFREQQRVLEELTEGRLRIVLVAPERFRSSRFLEELTHVHVAMLAVDEAHCVSEWGHDFRPDYRRLAAVREALGNPVTVALTATATERVQDDILEQLGLAEAHVFVSGFERPNLFLEVLPVRKRFEKIAAIQALCLALGEGTGICYCQTRKQATRVAQHLGGEAMGVGLYHGGMPDSERGRVQQAFMRGDLAVLVATNAFGMGIDRGDIRFVVHYGLPRSLEAYYQQVGRAGRDGEPARCTLLFSLSDRGVHDFFIDSATPGPELTRAVFDALEPEAGPGPRTIDFDVLAGQVQTAAPRARRPRRSLSARLPGASEVARTGSLAVRGAIRLLADAGIVKHRRGTKTLELIVPDPPEETVGVDWTAVIALREADRARLDRMVAFAEAGVCRARTLCTYFNDRAGRDRTSSCGHCDVCGSQLEGLIEPEPSLTPDGALPRPHGDDAATVVRKILSCIARMGGGAARGDICRCLAGSRAQRTLEKGHDRLSVFGILAPLSQDDVRTWVNALVDGKLLFPRGGRVYLTTLGIEIMAGRQAAPEGIGDGP
ncbi:MAG: RecQ family ATP-dependent DNA helicase [Planctomycetota bacterium]